MFTKTHIMKIEYLILIIINKKTFNSLTLSKLLGLCVCGCFFCSFFLYNDRRNYRATIESYCNIPWLELKIALHKFVSSSKFSKWWWN